jgi:hypothetical protein
MNALRRLVARNRAARAVLFAVLFPFFYAYYFVRYGFSPLGLSAAHGQIRIAWRDVLPLDQMELVLNSQREHLVPPRG